MRRVAVILAVATACAPPWLGGLPGPSSRCPVDAPVLGRPGGFAVDRQDLAWRYSDRLGASWAGPVGWEVAGDTLGVSLVIDAGDTPVMFGWVAHAGRQLVDGGMDGGFGLPARVSLDTAVLGDTFPEELVAFQGLYADPFYSGVQPAVSLALPMHEASRPEAGCLALLAVAPGLDLSGRVDRVAAASKRSPRSDKGLAVDVILLDEAGITTAQLEDALSRMATLYQAGDALQLDSATVWTLPGRDVPSGGAGLNALRATALDGAEAGSVRLIVARDFEDGDGLLGLAAGIPGPVGVPETAGSAVVVSVEAHRDTDGALDTTTLGETMAHEVGHQLGLFHTTEEGGESHDILTDTPECEAQDHDANRDGYVSAEECEDRDGRNVMFWTSAEFPQDVMSAQQADVLRRSAVAGAQEAP